MIAEFVMVVTTCTVMQNQPKFMTDCLTGYAPSGATIQECEARIEKYTKKRASKQWYLDQSKPKHRDIVDVHRPYCIIDPNIAVEAKKGKKL